MPDDSDQTNSFRQQKSGSVAVLFGLAQTPAFAALARYPTQHGPLWLRERVGRLKRKHKRLGYAMVPQKRLRATHRRSLTRLIETVGRDGIGDYLEFGVHSGTTLLCMYRELEAMRLNRVRLFGFDSFEGLPASDAPDDGGTWEPGAFKSDYSPSRFSRTSGLIRPVFS